MSIVHKVAQSVSIIELFPVEDECCICGCDVIVSSVSGGKGIPMYFGKPVAKDWSGEWAGFSACDSCFDKYERGETFQ